MITIKTQKEIAIMREGGKILAKILNEVAEKAGPGKTTGDLEELAEKLIKENGAKPSFKGYIGRRGETPFPTCLCTSINAEVVHAPALPPRALKSGDIIGLDLGIEFKGLYTDMAITVGVGKISSDTQNLIEVTRKSLARALKKVRSGNYVSDISWAVQKFVERNGYSVVRDLVGHGVGYKVHEDPRIPNFVSKNEPRMELKPGMTLAVEPMVTARGCAVKTLDDGWTIVSADGCLAAHFEHTVVVKERGCEILTL